MKSLLYIIGGIILFILVYNFLDKQARQDGIFGVVGGLIVVGIFGAIALNLFYGDNKGDNSKD